MHKSRCSLIRETFPAGFLVLRDKWCRQNLSNSNLFNHWFVYTIGLSSHGETKMLHPRIQLVVDRLIVLVPTVRSRFHSMSISTIHVRGKQATA